MKKFLDDEFLLETETARKLFHEYAEPAPIFDFHNHLDAKEIYEDKRYDNIAQVWLGGDHYKWRAMRADGIEETYITGNGDDYGKFCCWAQTVPDLIGNPLYHWTHMELQRYFDIHEPLSGKNAEAVWNRTGELLHGEGYSVRGLLKKMNVRALCTTNDPTEDLKYHNALRAEGYEISVLPTFRPDKALDIEKETFPDYIRKLEEISGTELSSLQALKNALRQRLDYFCSCGCLVSDHSLGEYIYEPATEEEVREIYRRRLAGQKPDEAECRKYHGHMLVFLGKAYAEKNLAMQLHIGAIRNNSSRMFRSLGADTGFDSADDFCYAGQISALMDALDADDHLPKTILYNLNPKDNLMLAAMAGNFQGGGVPGKIQFGAAWWLCDNKKGMTEQIEALEQVGLLSRFIGMLTDSRSFLSFPRHEYFRRILCNHIGNLVENGEYPDDMEYLGHIVKNICFENARRYFSLTEQGKDSLRRNGGTCYE